MKKTNAARMLERLGLSYRLREIPVDESDLGAERAAELLGLPLFRVFKTLVARGDKSGVITASVPGDKELDLKALARVSGDKKVEMVSLKEIQGLTGYIRGAVSPLGMKQSYPYYLDESAFTHPFIVVSAGVRGAQIEIGANELFIATGAVTGPISR